MKFDIEIENYKEEVLSYLENDWVYLKESVLEMPQSEFRQRLLFYINKAMRYKSVQDLNKMKETLLVIFDLVCKERKKSLELEVIEWLEDIRDVLNEIIKNIKA